MEKIDFILGALQKMLNVPAELYNSNSVHPTDDSISKTILKKKGKKDTQAFKEKKYLKKKE